MTLLAFTDVSARLSDGAREIEVLQRVSFEVSAGELVGVYGERRAGKSTLLRIAAGIESPSAGSIELAGQDLASLSPSGRARLRRRGGVALVSTEQRQPAARQAVVEHVALPLTGTGLTLAESEALARAAIERVGIGSLSHAPVERLSLSDAVRVELARAIAREPQLLLFDEPAVLPGPSDGRELNALLRGLTRECGFALLIASADLAALTGVDRLLTLSDGRLRSSEPRRRVIEFPGARARRAAS